MFFLQGQLTKERTLARTKALNEWGSAKAESVYSMPERMMCVDAIAKSTKRHIGIDFTEDEAIGKFNEQEASPLFSTLPRELRDMIWAYATLQYEDPNGKNNRSAHDQRLGHTTRLITDTALLLTCRRTWLEANAMPIAQAEHSFYNFHSAPDQRGPRWMSALTEHNRQNLGCIHLSATLFRVKTLCPTPGDLRRFFFVDSLSTPADFQPKVLHVSVHHTDSWNWEVGSTREMWIQTLLDTPDLRGTETLRLELEILDHKVKQLQPIIERIRRFESKEFETHLVDGKPTKTRFVIVGELKISEWKDPANIANHVLGPNHSSSALKYHTITLTWNLCFPYVPHAVVPELHRVPRIETPSSEMHMPVQESHVSQALLEPRPRSNVAIEYVQRKRWDMRARQSRKPSAKVEDPAKVGRRMVFDWQCMQRDVRLRSKWQSEHTEDLRRAEFESARMEFKAGCWRQRWKEEKSLLKFVD